jgi:hypothetical protein
MPHLFVRKWRIVAAVLSAVFPVAAMAQARVIKVVSSDSQPIAFANVIVEGGITQITDAKGEVSLGAGKRQALTVRVMRIGYKPWFGKLEFSDSAVTRTVALLSVAQPLATTVVTATAPTKSRLELDGFYDRWLMRQKGTLSAVFIAPEEIEFRHPDRITNMLYGLNGVQMMRTRSGGLAAFSPGSGLPGTCPMAIVIDGVQQYAPKGSAVAIDRLLDADDVAAIEVYARGGNMPSSLHVNDTVCGAILFWTGSRKP